MSTCHTYRRVVEKDDRQDDMQRPWQATEIQQSASTPLDHARERLNDGSFEQIDRCRGGARKHDIARNVSQFRFADPPQRATPFECGKHQKGAAHDDRRQHAPPGRAAHEIWPREHAPYAPVKHSTGIDNIEGKLAGGHGWNDQHAGGRRVAPPRQPLDPGQRDPLQHRVPALLQQQRSWRDDLRPHDVGGGEPRDRGSSDARRARDLFHGGEPFLNAQLLDMIACALTVAPTTVLTNGTLISERTADTLARLAISARYSLEVRVSLDGYTEEMNDAIRGRGVFRLALAGAVRLAQRNLLPSSPSFERGMTRTSSRRSPS